MGDTSAGPLAHGQLSLIRSLEYAGTAAGPETNIPQAWAIPVGYDIDTVEAAWFRLVELNDALRTVFDVEPVPTQRVGPLNPTPLETVGLTAGDAAAAAGQAAVLSGRSYAISEEAACSAVIGVHDDMPCYLISTYHHVVTDLVGVQSLRSQFDALLAGHVVARPPQPLELAAAQSERSRQHEATLAHWVRQWPGLVPEDRRGAEHAERLQATVYSRDALAAATTVSARHGLSVSSVILAATYLALAHVTGRSRFTLGLVASNRFNRRWDALVSTLNQLAPLTITVAPDIEPGAFLNDVYVASLEAYTHGSYDVDELRRRLVAAGMPDPEPMAFDSFFNFRGAVGRPPALSSAAHDGIEWQPALRQTGQSFNLVVGTDPEGLTLVARASRRYLADADLARLLAAIESALVGFAAADAKRVADVDLTPRRELTPRPADDASAQSPS